MADRKFSITNADRVLLLDGIEPETLLQQFANEPLRYRRTLRSGGLESRPECLANAEIACDLIAELETDWDLVSFFRLIARFETCDASHDIRRHQSADDLKTGEVEVCCATGRA
jgi:hypothetical protein